MSNPPDLSDVVICETLDDADKVYELLDDYLKERCLTLALPKDGILTNRLSGLLTSILKNLHILNIIGNGLLPILGLEVRLTGCLGLKLSILDV